MSEELQQCEARLRAMDDLIPHRIKIAIAADGDGIHEQIIKLVGSYEWLKSEVERLQAEKEDLKLRNRLLRDRPDLPIERLQAYDALVAQMDDLVTENLRLMEALTFAQLQAAGKLRL